MRKQSMSLKRQDYETSSSKLSKPLPITFATSTSLAISLPPIKPSLIVVRVPLVVKLLLARTALEFLAPARFDKFGVPLPAEAPVVAIYPRKGRAVEEARIIAQMMRVADAEMPTFECVGNTRDVNFATSEGQELVRQFCQEHPGGVITIFLSVPLADALGASLQALSNIAKETEVYLVVFAQTDLASDRAMLKMHADDYVELNFCESDPGAHATFSVASLELEGLGGFGRFKQMCELKVRDDGTLQARLTDFVSAKKLNRLLFDLAKAGWPRDRLAAFFKRDKSTISRALATMPAQAVRPKLILKTFQMRAEALGLDSHYWIPKTNVFASAIQKSIPSDDDDKPVFDDEFDDDAEPEAREADD